jgi:hypothetical protein
MEGIDKKNIKVLMINAASKTPIEVNEKNGRITFKTKAGKKYLVTSSS